MGIFVEKLKLINFKTWLTLLHVCKSQIHIIFSLHRMAWLMLGEQKNICVYGYPTLPIFGDKKSGP